MKRSRAFPRGLDRSRLRALLSRIDRRTPVGDRIEQATRPLLGRPYVAHPLIGSAGSEEVFSATLAGFDCVTYVETALSLALAERPAAFVEALRRVRYRGGRVAWRERHHYLTDWIRHNARAGLLRRVALPAPSVSRRRVLRAVPGLRPRPSVVRCWPKRVFWRARARVRSGDVLAFASTRPGLDVFHAGIAVWSGGTLRLRHASRSRGQVVEQDLADFLRANTMAGVIVARLEAAAVAAAPKAARPRAAARSAVRRGPSRRRLSRRKGTHV